MLVQIVEVRQRQPGKPVAEYNATRASFFRGERTTQPAKTHRVICGDKAAQYRPVYAVAEQNKPRADYVSLTAACKEAGVWHSALRAAMRRGSKANGRYWRYADMPDDQQPALKPSKEKPVIIAGVRHISIGAAATAIGKSRRAVERMVDYGQAQYAESRP